MELTSHSHPTRFISMAATSLDSSTCTKLSPHHKTTSNPHHTINYLQPTQMRSEKQYIDPNSMINFEHNLNNLGREFEKVHRKLTFSTASLQSQLHNIRQSQSPPSLSPNVSTSQSLASGILPNITATPLPNTSMPLPPTSKTLPLTPIDPNQPISSIGSAIDERLQSLRAKLQKLEQEDHENKIHRKITPKHQEINSIHVNKTWDKYQTKSQSPGKMIAISPKIGSLNTNNSLPMQLKSDPLDTSFVFKYQEYMNKYHGSTTRRHSDYDRNKAIFNDKHLNITDITSHSLPDYKYNTNLNLQKSKQNTQNMVNRIQEKSKALFATNTDFKSYQKQTKSQTVYNGRMQDMNERQIYKKSINNFDDRLNATWNKTQLQLNQIKKKSQQFQKTNATKYNFTDNQQKEYNIKPKPENLKLKPVINVNESIASSHWTLDSQTNHSLQLYVPSKLKMVNEEPTHSVIGSLDISAIKHGSSPNDDILAGNTYQHHADKTMVAVQTEPVSESHGDAEDSKNVINLSFNRGIQVTIPVVCKYCNRKLDKSDVVIRLENEESKEMEHEEEEKKQFIAEDGNKRKESLNISRDFVYHEQVCSTSTATLSRHQSSSSLTSAVNNTGNTCNGDAATSMSEYDRKQLIMDLKSMDADCQSDGYLLDERKRTNNIKNEFARSILNDGDCGGDQQRSKSVKSNLGKYDYCKGEQRQSKYKKKSSLRAKLNDLKRNLDSRKFDCDSSEKNREYSYLQQKLKIYENKLRNIDPSLLE